ncbi:MAG TPA: beta-ketoacyl synthase N-terminal-like domain-containing protein [Candidatus Dormibacteraeota bacterium]|jgi:acyl transferase domain-containing protein|nr:beta-ketoacyl synthase N-terminal-like domain-containing protein [Candidatus Dormibacteraeota bacterium]
MTTPNDSSSTDNSLDIAIVGMACRFPGANNIEEFWSNLVKGVESISWCSEQEVIASGFHPDIARDSDFIAAAGKLEGEYAFDAEFFGYSPREAEVMDPQHRLLLECAWEALEASGYNPESTPGRTGVFAGASTNTYFPFHVAPNHRLLSSVGLLQAITANDKDFLASRIAYKLNLKGPAISVQTACSTSLVAVNLACQSLNSYQCDMVLAGGVSVTPKGRLYRDGFIFSRDGHCRPFDEAAAGAVFGNGAGVVVLKRLEDALADGNHIHAVIKGSAVNNDGSLKAGYTAPSVTGQMEVIVESHALAGVDPQTIQYVEAHGTGTALGDPIEIAALTQAFRTRTERKGYCAVGSVKGNIGHLDAAAGIAGLIKTALVLEHKQIPATLHFQQANSRLNLENSPFFVNAELRDWPDGDLPRRAAVSSFGFGGTNAHAILEQAPACSSCDAEQDWRLVPISARCETAMKANALKLAEYCENCSEAKLEDVTFILQLGRKHFKKRGFAVVRSCTEAATIFRTQDPAHFKTGNSMESPQVVFMFPGQGSQSPNMGRELYETEPLFREAMDQCARLASQYLDRDLIDLIYPDPDQAEECDHILTRTQYTQPALFAIEYSLAKLWQSWGVQPASMIGHSVGEYVAACLAGVFSLDDAVKLICARAAAMQEQPAGSMLSVALKEAELRTLLPAGLAIAAVNAPNLCVVSGPLAAIGAFKTLLAGRGLTGGVLHVSHAFHSEMMEPASLRFASAFSGVKLSPPQIPFISNVTGNWITASQACSPEYWVHHLLATVRFSDGWQHLAQNENAIFLEVGPGHVLATLARQCAGTLHRSIAITSLCRNGEPALDRAHILTALGNLWLHGIKVEWSVLHHGKTRTRIPLPGYQFQRKLYLLPPVYAATTTVVEFKQPQSSDDQDNAWNQDNNSEIPPSVPSDEIETLITGIWEDVLGVPEIERDHNFFVLGGHSLMAIQLIAEIRRVTGTEISIKTLFQEPTIAALARSIRESKETFTVVSENHAIQPVGRRGDLPLTFHQTDVWEFETNLPETARYTGIISLSLKGNLIHEGLEFAVSEIMARHEVLRTTYRANRHGQPVATVHPPRPLCVPVVNLSHLSAETRERELVQSANRLVRTPFDLGHDVLMRPLLFKTGDAEHLFMISSHYIAVDGWTVGLIVREIGEHYAAYVESRPSRVPAVNVQCIDYAHWQRSQIATESLAPHLAYWRAQLLDIAPQEPLPLDRPRPLNITMNGSTCHFSLTPGLTRSLKHFSHQQGSTLFFTLVSALNVLFHLRSGSRDIVIGTITGDREAGMETVFGSYVNCLPLRNRLDPQQTFLEVMENTRRCTTDAYAHQVPFRKIAEAMGQDRNLIDDPLFRVTLVLRNIPFTEMRTGELEIQLSPLPVNRAVSEGDISLYLQEVGGDLAGYFEYNHEIFNAGTVEQLSADFAALLENIVASPWTKLCDFPIAQNSGDQLPSLAA